MEKKEKTIILIDNTVHEKAKQLFNKLGSVIFTDIEKAESTILQTTQILVIRTKTKITQQLLQKMSNLKLIATATSGTDHIDLKAVQNRNITLFSAQGKNADAVADYVLRVLLYLSDDITYTSQLLKQGKDFMKIKNNNQRTELNSKTLGIIGYGMSGRKVAKRARAFGMKIKAFDPFNKKAKNTFEEVLQCDIITLHCMLTDATKNLINVKSFAIMKKNAILINAARGEIIDENALYTALKEHKIKAAALDVFSNEPAPSKLYELPNVLCTPHIAGNTEEGKLHCLISVYKQVKEYYKIKNN